MSGNRWAYALVILVPAAVLLRGHIKFAYQNWFTAERVKRIEIKPYECAVVPTGVEVGGSCIHVLCAGARHFRIIKRLVAIAENQCSLVIGANNLANQNVIPFCHEPKEAAVRTDAIAARAQIKHTALLEFLKTLYGFGLEIVEQFWPVVMISLPEQLD